MVNATYTGMQTRIRPAKVPTQQKAKKCEARTLDTLTQDDHDALDTLQDNLVSAPVVVLPHSNGQLTLYTDASDKYIDCMFMQEHQDRMRKPLSNWSRMLNEAEKNYNTTHREFLVVVLALFLLCPYLERRKPTIYMDHDALEWILILADATSKWRAGDTLSNFELSVVHRASIKN